MPEHASQGKRFNPASGKAAAAAEMPEHAPATVVLPPIPAKRYFSIGEVSELCGVKAHVLRYWEQEFSQLKPVKRSGNRRYYQHHEVLLVRKIRHLLYDEGFTISGARNRLGEAAIQDQENAVAVVQARALLNELRAEVEATLGVLRG